MGRPSFLADALFRATISGLDSDSSGLVRSGGSLEVEATAEASMEPTRAEVNAKGAGAIVAASAITPSQVNAIVVAMALV